MIKGEKLILLDKSFNKYFECNYYEQKPIKFENVNVQFRPWYYNGLLGLFNGDKWGIIDLKGNTIIGFKYDAINRASKGYYSVVQKNQDGKYKYGLIDKNDNLIIDFQYDTSLFFGTDGISRANKSGEGYFINIKNQKVLQGLTFDAVDTFREGLAFVKKDNKWGIIDVNGREIFPCILDKISSSGFQNGIAAVSYQNKILLITYNEPSEYGYTYDDVNNSINQLSQLDGNIGFWSSLSISYADKDKKDTWTNEDYSKDLNNTLTYKNIMPDSWYVTTSGVWYYFENDRKTTKKGWFTDARDGQTYYLNKDNGRMVVGWVEIDGDMYYFNESHVNEPNWYEVGEGFYESYGKKIKAYGSMYKDEITPDGKRVDADGKIIK